MSNRPIFRFAPSPNGYLHLGHAYSAVVNYKFSQSMEGHFILRIEDIDTGRTREDFINSIYDDLKWLGLDWDTLVRRQSKHFPDYQKALEQLLEKGLLYKCFATRKDIAEAIANKNSPVYPLDPDGTPLYPQLHKHLSKAEIDRYGSEGKVFAYRIDMDAALQYLVSENRQLTVKSMDESGNLYERTAEPGRWGDTVIMRKDTPTSYHLSVVVDDAIQNVTHVVRGKDLEAASDLHVLLQELLGLPSPVYHHHGLLLDENGQKLSKSRGSKSLNDLRKEGVTAEEIHKLLAEK